MAHCQEDLRDLGFAAPEWRPFAIALPPLSGLPFSVFLLSFGSTPTSESSSCGDFAYFFPCLLNLAGVAVLSTALATTAQVVRGQVCWGGVGSHWSLLQHACAEKREHGSQPTSSSVTWICWASLPRISGALRSSPRASLHSTVPSWRWTPPSFHPSVPTARENGAVLNAARCRKVRSFPSCQVGCLGG